MRYRTWFISRFIVLVIIVLVLTASFVQYSKDRYDRGGKLTEKEYIEEFNAFKEELSSAKPYTSYANSFFVVLLSMVLIVASYEATVFLISLYLRKIIK